MVLMHGGGVLGMRCRCGLPHRRQRGVRPRERRRAGRLMLTGRSRSATRGLGLKGAATSKQCDRCERQRSALGGGRSAVRHGTSLCAGVSPPIPGSGPEGHIELVGYAALLGLRLGIRSHHNGTDKPATDPGSFSRRPATKPPPESSVRRVRHMCSGDRRPPTLCGDRAPSSRRHARHRARRRSDRAIGRGALGHAAQCDLRGSDHLQEASRA